MNQPPSRAPSAAARLASLLAADPENLLAAGAAPPAHLEPHWNRLAAATPQPDPFSATTPWQWSFREVMEPGRPALVRMSDQGLIQLACHGSSGGPVAGPFERLWLFGCNLLGPDAVELLEQWVCETSAPSGGLAVPLVVSGLVPRGGLSQRLRRVFEGRFRIRSVRAEIMAAASLEGGLDGYLSRRSANQRRNLRRIASKARQAGVVFERCTPRDRGEADGVFARMLAVEEVSWKGLSQSGMESPPMSDFYRAMLVRLARTGDGRVMFARLAGEDVGYVFGGMSAGVYRGQQFSFAAGLEALSIGNLLQLEQITWLCEQGARRYDLGPARGPSMGYKRHWAELELPIEAVLMRP